MKLYGVIATGVLLASIQASVLADDTNLVSNTAADADQYILLADNDDREDRRDERGRSDERQDKRDCRDEEGRVGKDKRDCKQEDVRDGVRGDDDKEEKKGAA